MSPILKGIIASQITGHLVTNSYESIATVTVGSGGASYAEFTSIPSTYKHLQIRGIGKTNRGVYVADDMNIRFNSDTANNYNWHVLRGNGVSASAANGGGSTSSITCYYYFGTDISFAKYSGFVIDILDYASSTKYKTFRALGGTDSNGGESSVGINSGLWMNSTNAINTIRLYSDTGSTIQQYSSFALYGVKG
jgi:hypothetical protein